MIPLGPQGNIRYVETDNPVGSQQDCWLTIIKTIWLLMNYVLKIYLKLEIGTIIKITI